MTDFQTLEPIRCAEMIRDCRKVVALTGAGISTAAGIPDFRGPKGLYVTRRHDPEKVFEFKGFLKNPGFFYEFCHDFVATAKSLRPTFSHRFLAALEQAGKLAGIVTQNIDMLHQLAGSRKVLELHGSCRGASCLSCRHRFENLSYEWWHQAMAESPISPVACCPVCQGPLKPDIVFFGERVKDFGAAEELVAKCDLLLVLGSSLQVAPASFLPHKTDAPTVIVNHGAVMLPASPHRFFLNRDLDGTFQEVTDCLARGEKNQRICLNFEIPHYFSKNCKPLA